MKEASGAPSYRLYGTERNNRTFFLTYTLSLLCHIVFFAIMIFAPAPVAHRNIAPSVINVSMVSLPQGKPAGKTGAPAKAEVQTPKETPPKVQNRTEAPKPAKTVKVEPKKAEPVESEPATKTVSLAPQKTEPKTSLKKKTFKSTGAIDQAIKKIEKSVEDTSAPALQKTLDRLREEVGKTEALKRQQDGFGSGSGSQGTAGASGPGIEGGSNQALEVIDIYRVEIAYRVQQNWAFSGQLAGDALRLQSKLVFKVLPNGEIQDVFFTERSGNEYLDDSAYKAVMKSNPVAPHPPGINRTYVELGLRFTPEGVNN